MLDKVERSRPGFFKKGCTTACLKLLGTAGGQIIINNIKDRGTNSSKNLLQKVNNITWEAKLFYTGKQFLKRGKGNRLQVIKDRGPKWTDHAGKRNTSPSLNNLDQEEIKKLIRVL